MKEQPENETERDVALAIGRIIWGSEVIPQGQWVYAARAAMERITLPVPDAR